MNNFTLYGFIAGRIKSLESKYLTADDFERLKAAKNLDEVKNVLADTFYSFLVEEKLNEEKEVKLILERFINNHFIDLTFNLSDKRVCQAFLSLFDLQNFKALFRERFFGFPAFYLSPLSSFSEAEMRKIVAGEKQVEPYSSWLAEAEKISEPRLLDCWLEKICSLKRLELGKSLKSALLEEWIKEEIKILNFKTLWRLKYYQSSSGAKFENFLITLALQDRSYYSTLIELSEEELLQAMSKELEIVIEDEISLEEALNEKFRQYFKKASLKISDPALIYFYLAARVKEVELIQMAIFSRLRNWQPAFFERVVKNYV